MGSCPPTLNVGGGAGPVQYERMYIGTLVPEYSETVELARGSKTRAGPGPGAFWGLGDGGPSQG